MNKFDNHPHPGDKPLVSVIIPTFNRQQFVIEAVRSVLRQSYTNYEIIVADDGSTDQTVAALKEVSGPLTVLELPHKGQGAYPRNRAIQRSKGELIAFLDHDDLWLEEKLERQVDLFLAAPHVSLVYCDARFLFPDGNISGPVLKPWQKMPSRLFEGLLTTAYLHPSTVMVRRGLIDRLGLFEEEFIYQSNHLFWLRTAHREPAGCVDLALTLVRRYPESRSSLEKLGQYEYLIAILSHFYNTEKLSLKARFLVRRAIARAHTHIGLATIRTGQKQLARRRFLLSLAWNPIQRRAWLALAGL